MAKAQEVNVPDEGALDAVNVPLILARAWRDRRSGCLQLAEGKYERRIQVRDGAPVAIDMDHAEDNLAQFLADTNQIEAADRLAVEQMAKERACPQASAVLALKLLDAKALYQALRNVARRQIAETFDWKSGHYRWMPATSEEHANARPHDLLALLQEQLPIRWGTERLFGELMAVQDLHGDISPQFLKVARKLGEAGAFAERALRLLDGVTPLGRVLGDCAGDPLAAATLWTVLHTGVLRLIDDGARPTQEERLQFDVQVEVDPSSAGAANEADATTEATPKASAADAKAESLRQEIESLLGQIESLDHYSALGLEPDANAALVKKAYFKAAKKYHPDALARLGLDDLKEPAARVFGRIAEAFETLSDPEKKAVYDSGGSEEPEIDMARLAQAETSFRKGEILAKMGNFAGALEYLVPAAELWPEEPAYQAGLGWALYKQPQSDLALAAHHLEIALSQAPDDAVIHFRLGVVMRASGENARADELIAQARAIDPDVEE